MQDSVEPDGAECDGQQQECDDRSSIEIVTWEHPEQARYGDCDDEEDVRLQGLLSVDPRELSAAGLPQSQSIRQDYLGRGPAQGRRQQLRVALAGNLAEHESQADKVEEISWAAEAFLKVAKRSRTELKICRESSYTKKIESFWVRVDGLREKRQYEHLAQLREHIDSTSVETFRDAVFGPVELK